MRLVPHVLLVRHPWPREHHMRLVPHMEVLNLRKRESHVRRVPHVPGLLLSRVARRPGVLLLRDRHPLESHPW